MYRHAFMSLLVVVPAVAAARADSHGEPLPPGALARLGTLRLKVAGRILAFSPDEKLFAVAARADRHDVRGSNNTPGNLGKQADSEVLLEPLIDEEHHQVVHLWSVATGLPIRRLEGPPCAIDGGLFSPDGKNFRAASHQVWEMSAQYGKCYVSSSPKQFIEWRVADGKRLREIKASSRNFSRWCSWESSALSRDGQRWAMSRERSLPTHEVMVGDTATGEVVASFRLTKGRGAWQQPVLSADGKRLAALHQDGWTIWDVATRKVVGEFKVESQKEEIYFGPSALSPDGRLLTVLRGKDFPPRYRLTLWQPDTGRTLLETGEDATVRAARFTPDGRSLLIATAKEVRVWDIARKRFARPLPAPLCLQLICSPGGRYLATVKGERYSYADRPLFARLWDLTTGEEVHPSRPGHASPVEAAAFSPDGRTLVSATRSEVRFWDVATSRPLHVCNLAPLCVGDLTFAPGAEVFVNCSQGDHGDSNLVVLDARTGAVRSQTPKLNFLALSPDGKRLLCRVAGNPEAKSDPGAVVVRKRATGREVCRCPWPWGKEVRCADFMPEGERFVFVSHWFFDKKPSHLEVQIHETETGKRLARWEWVDPEWDHLPPARRMLALFRDFFARRPVTARDLESAWKLSEQKVDSASVFSPDGAMLALHTGDRIELWETATGQRMHTLGGVQTYPCEARPLAFSPDGRRLVSGGAIADVLVWDVFGVEGRPKEERLTEEELRRCWEDLARSDGAAGYRTMTRLLGAPEQTVGLLRDRLTPAELETRHRWIADLSSDSFAVREKAAHRLSEAVNLTESELRQVLANRPDLETSRRIRALLEDLESLCPSGDRLRVLRAVQVLERLGTPAVQEVLQKVSGGTAGRAARQALARLQAMK